MKKSLTKKVTYLSAKKAKDTAYHEEVIIKPAERLFEALLCAKQKKFPSKPKTTAQSR